MVPNQALPTTGLHVLIQGLWPWLFMNLLLWGKKKMFLRKKKNTYHMSSPPPPRRCPAVHTAHPAL